MKTKYLLTLAALSTTLSLTSATKAEVNMKNASFLSHWLDMTIAGPSGSLEVRRFYNSRSARVGLFGFGWCSTFEKSLRVLGDTVTLSDCSLESEKEIKDIKRSPAGYDMQTDDNTMQFDKAGRLIKLKTKENLEITLLYSKENRLTKLKTNDGRTLDLIYDIRGSRVIEVRGSNGQKVKYEYTGDDLNAVISRKDQASYTYDDAHNITRIDRPDHTKEVIVYEMPLDRVKKYKAANGCMDSFEFKIESKNNYVSQAERSCANRIIHRATYKFVHDPVNGSFQPISREITGDRAPMAVKNWGITSIRAPQAQTLSGKKKVIVAIIDTGADIKLSEIKNHLWQNKAEILNGIDDDGNGYIDDIHGFNFAAGTKDLSDQNGHGTHIAGIIHSVAPNAELMILKYYEPGAHLSNIFSTVKAIEYAVKMGANVINYSGGGTFANPAEFKALEAAAKKNILLVAAAGNDGANNDAEGFFPATYALPNIISVASMNSLKALLTSSNYGAHSVDIAAPGFEIESTLPGGKTTPMTGTSQATAFVTGVAALVLSQNENLSFTATKERITGFSRKIASFTTQLRSSGALDAYPVLASRDASVNAFEINSRSGAAVADPQFSFPPSNMTAAQIP